MDSFIYRSVVVFFRVWRSSTKSYGFGAATSFWATTLLGKGSFAGMRKRLYVKNPVTDEPGGTCKAGR